MRLASHIREIETIPKVIKKSGCWIEQQNVFYIAYIIKMMIICDKYYMKVFNNKLHLY